MDFSKQSSLGIITLQGYVHESMFVLLNYFNKQSIFNVIKSQFTKYETVHRSVQEFW